MFEKRQTAKNDEKTDNTEALFPMSTPPGSGISVRSPRDPAGPGFELKREM